MQLIGLPVLHLLDSPTDCSPIPLKDDRVHACGIRGEGDGGGRVLLGPGVAHLQIDLSRSVPSET